MIAIVDYGVGNLFSVEKAFLKFSPDVVLTSDAKVIEKADKIVLPGVGAFGDCMKNFEQSGLGIFKGMVKKINAPGLKIPHMGWNSIVIDEENNQNVNINLFAGLKEEPYVYFVHSYQACPEDKSIILAKSSYGEELVAAVGKDNVVATQFHPEKSGDIGLKIIKNFVEG